MNVFFTFVFWATAFVVRYLAHTGSIEQGNSPPHKDIFLIAPVWIAGAVSFYPDIQAMVAAVLLQWSAFWLLWDLAINHYQKKPLLFVSRRQPGKMEFSKLDDWAWRIFGKRTEGIIFSFKLAFLALSLLVLSL